jgi:uncharacterized membrane protein
MDWASFGPTVIASFMASMVEFVEALTIVLAVGVVRGWRSALLGTGAALAVLLALIVVLGQSLSKIPLPVVQLVVGTLLLMFGLRWLRKAILRAGGVLPLHDEAKAFAEETEELRKHGRKAEGAIDQEAFLTSFKIVMLEGIEVVFIVIAIGASSGSIVPASLGAALALLVVVLLGLWLHRPLANVPENGLKFGVGVMLAAFGTFWVGEGIGLEWPGADWAVLALIAAYFIIGLALVRPCDYLRRKDRARPVATAAADSPPSGVLSSIVRELVGLFIDDGYLAAGVVVWVGLAWIDQSHGTLTMAWQCSLFVAGFASILALSVWRRALT